MKNLDTINTHSPKPSSALPASQQSPSSKVIYLIALLFSLGATFLFSGVLVQKFLLQQSNSDPSFSQTLTAVPTSVTTIALPTPSSQVYGNYRYNFSVQYPLDWKLSENNEKNSIMFYDPRYLSIPRALDTAQLFCVIDVFQTQSTITLSDYLSTQLDSEQLKDLEQIGLASRLLAYQQKVEKKTIVWTKILKYVFRLTHQNEPNALAVDQEKIQHILDTFAPVIVSSPTASVSKTITP